VDTGAVEKRGLTADLSVIAFSFSEALASKEAKTESFGEGGFVALRVLSSLFVVRCLGIRVRSWITWWIMKS